jgi:phospholipid/cholesterol/gamma-HCH transport system substrate-binding protein
MKRRAIGAAVVLALLAGLVVLFLPHDGSRHGTAYFVRAVGLYKGSEVRILGVRVGEVKSVKAEGDRVRVDFVYDDKYKVPADAKAVVIAASVVSDRYRAAHTGLHRRPDAGDGARIRWPDTAVPVELDRIFSSLNDLDVALGPKGANKNGALSRLLQVGADNLDGEGANINRRSPTCPPALTRWPTARTTSSEPSATWRSSPRRSPRATTRSALQHRPRECRRPARGGADELARL